MAFPDYTISIDLPNGLEERQLDNEIRAAGPYATVFQGLTTIGDTLKVHFDQPPTAPNITTIDGVIAAHPLLANAKLRKNAAIDKRTGELVGLGFEWPPASGIMFSLSENAQRSLLTADLTRNDVLFAYPVTWNSKDDINTAVLATPADLHNFFLQALGTGRAHLDSGTALKDQVRAAATVAAVNAIIDPR